MFRHLVPSRSRLAPPLFMTKLQDKSHRHIDKIKVYDDKINYTNIAFKHVMNEIQTYHVQK